MFPAETEMFKIISVITMIKVIRMNRVLTMLGASTLILNEANVPHYLLFNRSQRGRYKISGYMYPY